MPSTPTPSSENSAKLHDEAARRGDSDSYMTLLNAAPSPPDSSTALSVSARQGHAETTAAIIAGNPSQAGLPSSLTARQAIEQLALHSPAMAIIADDFKTRPNLFDTLLRHGASMSLVDTPPDASSRNQPPSIETLIRHGASMSLVDTPPDASGRNEPPSIEALIRLGAAISPLDAPAPDASLPSLRKVLDSRRSAKAARSPAPAKPTKPQ